MNKREFKDNIYGELAKVVKAMGNPVRLEIIDLLAQGPFSVEQIAKNINQSIANTSQHLQTLKNARIVKVEREGNFIHYSLAGENVFDAWLAMRELGFAYNAEVEKVMNDFRNGYSSSMDAIDSDTLEKLLKNDEIVLLDVRPKEEYNRGHIYDAISTPVEDLHEHIKNLPKKKTIIAYCRGPFCVYADEAVSILKENGYTAKRMNEGYPEWERKGLPVINP